jgi:uncharacterized membrane protein
VLIGLLVTVFLSFEARCYRYFDIWRARVRLMEVCMFGPILRREGGQTECGADKGHGEGAGATRHLLQLAPD